MTEPFAAPDPARPGALPDRRADVPDLGTVGQACFALHARMTARALTRAYDSAMRPSGLRAPQFAILSIVGQGLEGSETRLAQRLGLERTTLVRNLKLLARKGWVEPVPGEGRGLGHRLTPSGRERLAAAVPLWQAMQAAIEGKLGPETSATVHDALRGLRRASR